MPLPEIHQGQTMQALQLDVGGVLPGLYTPINLCAHVSANILKCNWEVETTVPPVIGSSSKATNPEKPVTVSYLTEQTSHHPPVSAYQIECPEKGISARGFDQLSANFTGTRIKVAPGEHNRGIYITLHNFNDETYNMTHPVAHLSGILKGTCSTLQVRSCMTDF